jgi:hypothetical protein
VTDSTEPLGEETDSGSAFARSIDQFSQVRRTYQPWRLLTGKSKRTTREALRASTPPCLLSLMACEPRAIERVSPPRS